MTIALATCSWLPEGSDDAQALIKALDRAGLAADPVVWDGPADWSSHDLVIIRSTWDYTTRRDEFLAWARGLPRLLNPVDVLSWNTDKRYLRELADAGVPVVPTLWDPSGVPAEWPEYVVKPAVSIGCRDTARWGPGEEAAARAHLRSLREGGRTAMVQPYLSAIDTEGETALVFLDGAFSHAGRKAPILTAGAGVEGPVVPGGPRGQVTAAEATAEQLAVAEWALAAVPGGPDLLYARVDLVPGPDGSPVVIELELAEPNLYLQFGPGAADRLAGAVAARL
ncbi:MULTISPECIES: ATP-grasp domain-containing protein [Thermomonosporaceae]|uniref:ATP-grasp domain-containing protein n=1 Tax=Thermomonosporaceae TaxID=2012 RepID=UPI00255A939D|nr:MULTISPECIES: hypothetical protein [Thermomonosporaceae]MDL4770977.1 hypothetical protein [Actinomadura xylanilytica]